MAVEDVARELTAGGGGGTALVGMKFTDDVDEALPASRVRSPRDGSKTWWPPFTALLAPTRGELVGERDTGDMASTGLKLPDVFPFPS